MGETQNSDRRSQLDKKDRELKKEILISNSATQDVSKHTWSDRNYESQIGLEQLFEKALSDNKQTCEATDCYSLLIWIE